MTTIGYVCTGKINYKCSTEELKWKREIIKQIAEYKKTVWN